MSRVSTAVNRVAALSIYVSTLSRRQYSRAYPPSRPAPTRQTTHPPSKVRSLCKFQYP
jgi:hypothetical protein